MKHSLLSLLLLITLSLCFGCRGKVETPAEEIIAALADTVPSDSVAEDSVKDTIEITPPKKADELFNDFVYAFMKNRRFQRSRIVFPLAYTVDGVRRSINRKEWKFDRMFSNREVYTLIFDSRKGMRMAKDTSLRHVLVEELDLEANRVKRYTFRRTESEWQLTALDEAPMEESANSEFYAFYRNFADDADFRQAHIVNPLEFTTLDEDTFQPIKGIITPDQWPDFGPELPTREITNILYGQSYRNSALRLLTISSISGGMTCTLTFKREGEEWMLVKLDN